MYSCKDCNYETNRKDTYNRHLTSGKHLRKIAVNSYQASENVVPISENVVPNSENVVPNSENVVPNSENVVPISENVAHSNNNVIYNCKKCNKEYNKKEYLINHEKRCKGIDSLTCPKCMRTFSDRQAKYKHCKRNTCKPVSIFEADNIKSIINNNNCNNNNNNTNCNNNIVNNTNIYINDYGKERKDYLLDYDNFYDMVRVPNNSILVKYLKCKNFNPQFPENHCIKYENRRFKMKENNKWSLINANALKDKLFYDCGSEVLYVFGKHEEKIRNQLLNNIDQYKEVKKKSNFFELQLEGSDKEIKNRMLDIVKDDV
jgi:hypothetical protein